MDYSSGHISLFRFSLLSPNLDGVGWVGLTKALPILFSKEQRLKYNFDYTKFTFQIGQNIAEETLKSLFKEIYSISTLLFECGFTKAYLNFDPTIDHYGPGQNGEFIHINFDFSEKPSIWNTNIPEPVDMSLCLADIGTIDTSFSADKFFWKHPKGVIDDYYKSCKYLGFAPIRGEFCASNIFDRYFNPNQDFLSILKFLRAKTIDEHKYEALEDEYYKSNRKYTEDYSWNYGPRMCEECRDVGSCLGIRDCGFM